MTKLDIIDRIQLALRELADVKIQLDRIESCPIESRKSSEYLGEGVSRAFGRVQGMASHADSYLKFAVENLIQCLPVELQAIPIKPLSDRGDTTPMTEEPCQS